MLSHIAHKDHKASRGVTAVPSSWAFVSLWRIEPLDILYHEGQRGEKRSPGEDPSPHLGCRVSVGMSVPAHPQASLWAFSQSTTLMIKPVVCGTFGLEEEVLRNSR